MRRLLPFILIILLIALVVSIPLFLPLDRHRTQLSDSLSRRLNHKVVIGRLEVVLFPPALRLRDVGILDPAEGSPLLQIEQVLAPISWQALFKGKIAPQSINLRGWTAALQRNPDGTWDWGEWVVPATDLSNQTGWPIKAITFDRGECRAIDPYGPGPTELTLQVLQGAWERDREYVSIKGVFTSLPAPVNFLFQGSGHFVPDPQWAGVLEFNTDNQQYKVECKVGGGRVEATGQADQWRFDIAYAVLRYYSRLPFQPPVASSSAILQGWQSRYEWQGSTLSFHHSASVAGGRSEMKGAVVFNDPQSIARVDMAVQTVSLQPMEAVLWGSSPLEGTATGLAHFELTLSSSPWSTLTGQGALEIKDGKYFMPDVTTRNLSKARTLRYVIKKYPGFLGGGMPFKKASTHWQMRRGVISFDDGAANLGDIKIGWVGTYDVPRRGLDAYTRVQIRERNPQLVKELPPAYVDLSQGAPHIQPMHGRIQGTPAQWFLRAVRASKVPPSLLNKLSSAISSN